MTALRREGDQRFSTDLEQQPIGDMTSRLELFNAVKEFPVLNLRGEEFPYLTRAEFIAAIETRIQEAPDKTHFLIFVGGPAQGKSTIESEAAKYFSTFSPASRVMKRRGYHVETFHLAWGDGFDERLPEAIRVHNDYDKSPQQREAKQNEVNQAETLLIGDLTRFLKWDMVTRAQDPKVIRLVLGDIPLDSGLTLDGINVGILRGLTLLSQLTHHTGPFEQYPYGDVFSAGTVASWPVREHAMRNREIAQSLSRLNQHQIESSLKERGMEFLPGTNKNLRYGALKETAPPDEIRRIVIGDNSEVIFALSKRAIAFSNPNGAERVQLVLPPDIIIPGSTVLPTLQQIREEHEGRTQAMGEIVLPYIFSILNIPVSQATILYNQDILPRVTVHAEHLSRRISGKAAAY